MEQYTLGQFLKKFWYFYAFGLIRILFGIQEGRYDSTDIFLGLGLALVLNVLCFLIWRAWNLRKSQPEASSISASPEHKAEVDSLLNAGLPLAQQFLAKHGGFQPFGASMDSSGKIAVAATLPDTDTGGKVAAQMIVQGLKAQAREGKLRASAIFADVTVAIEEGKFGSAIEAYMEHQHGEAMRLYLPYEKVTDGQLQYGKLFGSEASKQIFGTAG